MPADKIIFRKPTIKTEESIIYTVLNKDGRVVFSSPDEEEACKFAAKSSMEQLIIDSGLDKLFDPSISYMERAMEIFQEHAFAFYTAFNELTAL